MQGNGFRSPLAFSLLATAVVVVLPAVIVALLPGEPGPAVGVPVCVALSLAFARAGAALWRRSPRSRETMFADLMLWGWARRFVTERRLARAESLVSGATGDAAQRVRALERVSAMLESRDAYTRRHSLRVTRYSEAIARELGLEEAEVARVRQAAALHDVGKFFTPRAVLNKPGSLTDAEFAIIKRHPGQGADLLRGVVEPRVEAMIRHHHERLGGNGYPDRLVGDAIPLGARIIAVADTFDAMTSTRAYRAARPHAKALAVLREEAGFALDARAVSAFEAIYSGRRSTAWSSVASGLSQTLAPLRELIAPAARALPALGASAALTAPVLVGGGLPASAAEAGPSRERAAATQRARPARAPVLAARLTSRPPAGTGGSPRARRRPGSAPQPGETVEGGLRPGGGNPGAPAARDPKPGSGGGPGGSTSPDAGTPTTTAPGGGGDGGAGGETPQVVADTPAATAAPTTAPAPAVPTAAPTSAPEVTTPEVPVGDVTIPGVEVDLPDLPVDLPDLPVPPIKLPFD